MNFLKQENVSHACRTRAGCVIVCLLLSLTHVSAVAHCCLGLKEARLSVCVSEEGEEPVFP